MGWRLFNRRFWELAIQNATKQSQKRFIVIFDEFFEGVVQQAIDRSGGHIRDIRSYLDIRRKTIGVIPSLVMLELGLRIPDEVMSLPAIQKMTLACTDIITLTNISNICGRIASHIRLIRSL